MILKPGDEISCLSDGRSVRIDRKLGEGTQGVVYRATDQGRPLACKWYHAKHATPDQKAALELLIEREAPSGEYGSNFVWPLEIVEHSSSPSFGYLMPLVDRSRFFELGECQSGKASLPGYDTMCQISKHLALSFKSLHLEGFCYRDLSCANLLFDPTTGDVRIIDNDNVGVEKVSKCSVLGTMEYMAPEVVRLECDPSRGTDYHSLAVILFQIWTWHHPMHGAIEYGLRSWDLIAKRKVYGAPVFVFDPHDKSNALPPDNAYAFAAERWRQCPQDLKIAFTQAFVDGTKNPAARLAEGQWVRVFAQLESTAFPCLHCRAVNLWDRHKKTQQCWHCKSDPICPPHLVIKSRGDWRIALTVGRKVLGRDIFSGNGSIAPTAIIAEVVQNPANPKQWGLKNRTKFTWTVIVPGKPPMTVPPDRSVPFSLGTEIKINEAELAIRPASE